MYRIRPPTSLSLPTHEHSNVFTASITIAEVCSASGCSAHSVKNFQQQLLEYMSLPIRNQHSEQMCQLQNCVAATHSAGHCQLCLKKRKIEIDQFSGPLVLAVNQPRSACTVRAGRIASCSYYLCTFFVRIWGRFSFCCASARLYFKPLIIL